MSNVKVQIDTGALSKVFEGANRRFFRKAGAYLMRVARNSIKRKPYMNKKGIKNDSPEGTPPFYHGSAFGGGLTFKQSVQFSADDYGAVIGPIAGPLGAIGQLHEFGGTQTIEYIDSPLFQHVFKVGELGPISTKKFKNWRDYRTHFKDPLTGYPVTHVMLESKRMAEHSTRLQARLLKANKIFHKTKTVNYPARPFMWPALQTSEPYLLKIFRESIK